MKYSIITPIYNSEKTIKACVESITCSPFSDYEIILVNDGSTDKSGEECKSLAERFSQVRYFYKENGGVSSARNLGLSKAEGKYILFVDSDDTVSENYFETLNKMTENDCELYEFSCRLFDEENEEIRKEPNAIYKTEDEAVNALCAEIQNRRINTLWTKIYLNDRIKALNLKFSDMLYIGEDQLFIVSYALGIKSFLTSSEILYNVSLLNGDSLSRKVRPDLTEQLILGHRELFGALKNAGIIDEYNERFNKAVTYSFYRSAYSAIKETFKLNVGKSEQLRLIKNICEAFLSENIKPVGLKCKVLSIPVRLKVSLLIQTLFRLRG